MVLVGVQGISCCKLVPDRRSQLSDIAWHMFCSTSASLSGEPTPTPLPGATVNTTSPPWKCAISAHVKCKKSKHATELEVGTEYILSFCSTTHTTLGFNQYCLITHRKMRIISITKIITQLSTKLGELTSFTYQLRVTGAQSAHALRVHIWNSFILYCH